MRGEAYLFLTWELAHCSESAIPYTDSKQWTKSQRKLGIDVLYLIPDFNLVF